jgi:hypothetical protein
MGGMEAGGSGLGIQAKAEFLVFDALDTYGTGASSG